ncbi:unnamed protein product, partial [Heterosigma akashiwo]
GVLPRRAGRARAGGHGHGRAARARALLGRLGVHRSGLRGRRPFPCGARRG